MDYCHTTDCCDWDYICIAGVYGTLWQCSARSVGCLIGIGGYLAYTAETDTDAACCESYCEVWDHQNCGLPLG
jgi:hypothetical protein